MTTATRDTASLPFTERLLRVLRGFDRCRELVHAEARSADGIGRAPLLLRPPFPHVPPAVLQAVADGWGVTVRPATADASGISRDLPAAVVVWHPCPRFDRSTGWRSVIPEEEAATIRSALAAFPLPPSFLIDGGHTVVGLWTLVAPLAVDRESARAEALYRGLAARLGGAEDVSATTPLPLAGIIRGEWNPGTRIELVDVAPGQTYLIEALERALRAPTTKGGRP